MIEIIYSSVFVCWLESKMDYTIAYEAHFKQNIEEPVMYSIGLSHRQIFAISEAQTGRSMRLLLSRSRGPYSAL